jgi:hypothetical protein
MRLFFCYCNSVIHLFLGKAIVLKRAIERTIVFKNHDHDIDDPPALKFSFNFTVGWGFFI